VNADNELYRVLLSDRRASQSSQANPMPIDEPRPRARTASLIGEALASIVSVEDAMHPDRARVGNAVVNNVCDLINVDTTYPQVPQRSFSSRSSPRLDKRVDIIRTPVFSGVEAVIADLFFDSMPRSHVEIESIARVSNKELLKKFLVKVTEQRSSVEATFHGTQESNIGKIISEGLSAGSCQRGLYGKGAYVGTHAGLANKYTSVGRGGRRHMFVVLVDVGTRIVQGIKGKRHSVTAVDEEWNPSQYCFVEEDRLFVSHLITYVITNEKGPFSRILSNAVIRSGQQVQKTGVR